MHTQEKAINRDPSPGSSEVVTQSTLVDAALAMLVRHWDELSEQRRYEILTAAARRSRQLRGTLMAGWPTTAEPPEA